MNRIIIVSHQRAGTHYLASMLNSHSKIHVLNELTVDKRYSTSEIKMLNLPITYKEVVGYVQMIEHLTPPKIKWIKDLKPSIIFLWRNLEDSFRSLEKAKKTGVWVVTKSGRSNGSGTVNETSYNPSRITIKIDKEKEKHYKESIEIKKQQALKAFENLKSITVNYENIPINEILRFLDVETEPLIASTIKIGYP